MSPTVAGVVAAVLAATLAVALMNVVSEWCRRRVRARFVGQNSALPSIGLPDMHLPFEAVVALVTGAVGFAGLVVDGAGLAIIASFTVMFGCLAARTHRRRTRLRTYNRQLLRVLDAIVLSLRSGSGLIGGFREAAVAHDGIVEADLCEVIRLMNFGVNFEDALQEWTKRCPLRSVRLTVACVTLAYETGGSSAESIGAVRATVRNALNAEASAQTHAAQARASATMLSGLPFAISGPMMIFNDTARLFMLHTPIGLAVLISGLGLDALGLWWMSVMIARAQS